MAIVDLMCVSDLYSVFRAVRSFHYHMWEIAQYPYDTLKAKILVCDNESKLLERFFCLNS